MIRFRLIGGSGLLAMVLGGVTWAVHDSLWDMQLQMQARQPLTSEEADDLEACVDPGWSALSRVLEQDLEHTCGPRWLATRLGSHLRDQKLTWVHRIAVDNGHTPRQRLRAGLALREAGRTSIPNLPFLVTSPQISDALRDELLEELYEEDLQPTWMDPVLQDRMAWMRFEDGDLSSASDVLRDLYIEAARPGGGAVEVFSKIPVVLERSGLSMSRLRNLVERAEGGYALHSLPAHLEFLIVNRGADCMESESRACIRLAADLLAAELDRLQETSDAWATVSPLTSGDPHLPDPLWEILYDGDLMSVAAAGARFEAFSSWVAASPEDVRAERLLGLVASPEGRFGVEDVLDGRVGDPLDPLARRKGSPWASAVAAVAIGEEVGLDVQVGIDGASVVLSVDDHRVKVGPCGVIEQEPVMGDVDPWPVRSTIAMSAIEAAGAELRRGATTKARRLAAFARHMDPVVAGAADRAITEAAIGLSADAPHELGRFVGTLAAESLHASTDEVLLQRQAVGGEWLVQALEWGTEGAEVKTRCPHELGPFPPER